MPSSPFADPVQQALDDANERVAKVRGLSGPTSSQAPATPTMDYEALSTRYDVPANVLMAVGETGTGDIEAAARSLRGQLNRGLDIDAAVTASLAGGDAAAGNALLERSYQIADEAFPEPRKVPSVALGAGEAPQIPGIPQRPAQDQTAERPGIAEQAWRDTKRGFSNLANLGVGVAALGADLVGADQTADSLLRTYVANAAETERTNPAVIGTYKNIGSWGDAGRYAVEALAENLPMMLPSLVTGGVGAAAARKIAERGVAAFVEKQVAAGVAKEAAEKQAATLVARRVMAGSAAGAVPASVAMESGGIYGDTFQETGKKAPGLSIAYGVPAGLLDAIEPVQALTKIAGPAAREMAGGIIKRMGVEAGKQFLIEAGTEGLQTMLEQAPKSHLTGAPYWTQDLLDNVIDAALKGGIAGGVMGAGSGAAEGFRADPGGERKVDLAPALSPEVPDTPAEAAGATGPMERAFNDGLAEVDAAVSRNAPIVGQRVMLTDEVGSMPGTVVEDGDFGIVFRADDGQIFEYGRHEIDSGAITLVPGAGTQAAPVDASAEPVAPEPAAPLDKGYWGDRFEERAGILEFDEGLSREEAERIAREEIDRDRNGSPPAAEPQIAESQPAADDATSNQETQGDAALQRRLAYLEAQGRRSGWDARLIAARDQVNAALDQRSNETVPVGVPTDEAAHEAATSPRNDLPEPTQAQKEAGNYRLGHLKIGGLDISVENPEGSERKGVDKDGRPWSVTMKSHYGYIRGTVGRDKDHVDAFVRPGTTDIADDDHVFVVNQVEPTTGHFDEHKVLIGFRNRGQAEIAYRENYSRGWKGFGSIVRLTGVEFKDWLAHGDTTKPIAVPPPQRGSRNADGLTVRDDGGAGTALPVSHGSGVGERLSPDDAASDAGRRGSDGPARRSADDLPREHTTTDTEPALISAQQWDAASASDRVAMATSAGWGRSQAEAMASEPFAKLHPGAKEKLSRVEPSMSITLPPAEHIEAARKAQAAHDAASTGKPDTKPKSRRKIATEREAAIVDYFTPGNIVRSSGGFDRVLGFEPSPDGWGNIVSVQAVRRDGGRWVDVTSEPSRKHGTMPTARDLKAGPVERATTAGKVELEARDESEQLDQRREGVLAGVPATPIRRADGGKQAERGTGASSRADTSGDEPARSIGADDDRGVGDGAERAPVPAAGTESAAAGQRIDAAVRDDAVEAGNDAEGSQGRVTPADGTPAPQVGADFTILDEDEIGAGGAKTKFRGNLAAIRLLKQLEREGRQATRDEQAVLAKFVGWGGLQAAFGRTDGSTAKGWEKEAADLRATLTEAEYQAAAASTRNAHYTSPEIVTAMWDAVRRLGFSAGRVLEPSIGVGNFIGLMPADLRGASAIHGVELDGITGGIAKQLYPGADIAAPMGFQDYVIPDGYFDAVVGNPPFGAEKLYDPKRKDLRSFSIHNYFFAKAVDSLRPNGVLAMVVTNRMMDGASDRAREYVAARTDLLGAIRLPNNAFAKNAGTEVTTDIIFLRRRAPGESATGETWAKTVEHTDAKGNSVPLNEYFSRHPEMMLGEFGAFGSMYRPDDPALIARAGQNTPALLRAAIERLPQGVVTSGAGTPTKEFIRANIGVNDVRVGSMFLDGDTVMIREADALGKAQASPVEFGNDKARERVVGMIGVRDALSELRRMQLSPVAKDAQIDGARRRLNDAYDAFVKANGIINMDANKRLFRDDPSWPQISALEDGVEKAITPSTAKKTGEKARAASAKKAAIFTRRTQSPYAPPTRAASAKDALVASLSETGRVDLSLMARLYGKPQAVMLKELGDRLFNDPQRGWVAAEEYLSGNVKAKLAEAEQAARDSSEFERNVDALRAVQPADVEAVDIAVKPGAHWIPTPVMTDFVRHIAGSAAGSTNVAYDRTNARWMVRVRASSEADARWGTSRAGVDQVLQAALNQTQITIRDRKADDTTVVNETETQAANEKVAAVRAEWDNWIWQDDTRRRDLARLYNDLFNTTVNRAYDGSHLAFPGKVDNAIIQLRPHQANAVWRALQSSTALFDHVVGAGKTFTAVAASMEMRRMGLARKPMFVVPNHLVGQWAKDFLTLYPGANVLATTKRDFEADNRKRLFSRIAVGDWDAVIVAHSSFGKVEVEPEAQAEFIDGQVADLMDSLESIREQDGGKAMGVKEIQKRITLLKEKQKHLIDTGRKDNAIYWGELGIDALFVDEAHEFKNLAYSTGMQRVAGLGNKEGSQKASDLYLKVRQVLKATGGRNVVFMTGTPISNTMAEMFTMQRYLDGAALAQQGLSHFDAWARQFGEVVTDWELSPAGKYKLNSRFAKFVNMPELMQRYTSFADVITRDDIRRQLAAQGKRLPIPAIKGGKPENIVVDRSPDQAVFIGEPVKDKDGNDTDSYPEGSLIHRAEHLPKRPERGADNMLKIMSDARKAALDMRIIDPGYGDYDGSKVNQAARRIKGLYRKWDADKGTQLVFIDLSTPKGARADEAARIRDLTQRADDGDEAAAEQLAAYSQDDIDALNAAFSVYDDLKAKLVRDGIRESEVAFIHDAKTELQKDELFAKVRTGRVRVLLGSTSKMGAGTNVQTRLVGLHHLDAPWRPSDLEQREGRIVRQGNDLFDRDPDGFEVEVLRYATRNTLDSRMWQTIEGKARFIEQVRKGSVTEREIEDIGGEASNAAEMKAASSGNPLILEEMTLRQAIRRLENEQTAFRREQYRIRDKISEAERSDAYWSRRATEAAADAQIELPKPFAMTIDGHSFEKRSDAGAAIMNRAREIIASKVRGDREIGSYGGFTVKVHVPSTAFPTFTLVAVGAGEYETNDIGLDNDPVGAVLRLTNTVADLGALAEKATERAEAARRSIPGLRSQIKGEWARADELETVAHRHEQVLGALKSKKKEEPADGAKFSVAGMKPDDFVPAPDGGIDFGEIGSEVGRQIAPIRLRVGDESSGYMHIMRDDRLRELKQFGFNDARELTAHVVKNYDAIFKGRGTSLFLVIRSTKPNHMLAVKLEPGATTDFYDIKTAAIVRADYFDRKEQLWGRAQTNQPVSRPPSAISGQSRSENIASDDGNSKSWTPAVEGGFATAVDAQAHLRESAYGLAVSKMLASGRLVIHSDAASLPGSNHPPGVIQGMTAKDGTIHLVASNLTHDTATAVLLHEAFHSGVRPLIGDAAWNRVLERVDHAARLAAERAAGGLRGASDVFWGAALTNARVAETPDAHFAEEVAAYAVEHHDQAPAGVREMVDRIIGAVQAWLLRRFGIQVGDVTPAELRSLAVAALRDWDAEPVDTITSDDDRYSVAAPTAPGKDRLFERASNALSQAVTAAMVGAKGADRDRGRFSALALVPTRPLFIELAQGMPSAKTYMDLKMSMDTMRNDWHALAADVVQRWTRLAGRNKAANEELMSIMHESTLAQVDPAKAFESFMTPGDWYGLRNHDPETSKYEDLLEKEKEDKARRIIHKNLTARYAALPVEVQKLFREVRDHYARMADATEKQVVTNVEEALKAIVKKAERTYDDELKRIQDDGLTGRERDDAIEDAKRRLEFAKSRTRRNKAARLRKLRADFESNRLRGAYFPLARYGHYFATLRDGTGKVISFSRFESLRKRDAFVRQIKETQPDVAVETGVLDAKPGSSAGVDPKFMADIDAILDGAGAPEALRDELWQRYLQTLPDLSIRKNRLHRKGTQGFDTDAMRAFAHNVFHGSHQLARLTYGIKMQDAIDEMGKQAQEAPDADRAKAVANEIKWRHNFIMNPSQAPLSHWLTSAAFVWTMGANLSSAVVNIDQTFTKGIPWIAADAEIKPGVTKTVGAITAAMRDFTMGGGWAEKSSRLTADEKAAMRAGYENGLIDRTQAHDVAGVAETGVAYSPTRDRIMKFLSWPMHQTERFNREVTFLAAYRLARAKGLGHGAAVAKASDLTWLVHFDNQSTSKPRIMQGDIGRVAFAMKSFQANILYRIFRDLHQATQGEAREVRREAFGRVAGTFISTLLAAGVKGAIGYSLVMTLAGAFMGDDDPDEELRRWVLEHTGDSVMGRAVGGMMMDGIPGYLTGTALSGRIGMSDLWFRSNDRDTEGAEAFVDMASQVLGVPFGLAYSAYRGAEDIGKGDTWRGAESMSPAAIRNALKATRYAWEGALNRRGAPIVEDVSVADIIKQAVGLTPAQIAEQSAANTFAYNMQERIRSEKSGLMDTLWRARSDPARRASVIEDIQDFNRRHPAAAITPKGVNQSMKGRDRYMKNAIGGASIDKRLRPEIESKIAPSIY